MRRAEKFNLTGQCGYLCGCCIPSHTTLFYYRFVNKIAYHSNGGTRYFRCKYTLI